jgi:drug/metabolite transporter (DMT)-like permease
MSDGRRSMLLMIVFVALWAAVEVLAAGVLSGAYSPYQVVWTRYAVHLLAMLALFGWRDPASLLRTQRPLFQLARSLLMLVMPASWIIAMQQGVGVGTLMSIFWLSPLLVLGLAHAFLGERAPWPLWLAAAIGCAGAVLLLGPSGPLELRLLPALTMALSYSLYTVMTRPLRSERTRANLFYTALGVFLALSPVMPSLWITPGLRDLAVLCGVGLLGLAGLYALDRLAAAAPVSLSAPLTTLHLVFAMVPAIGLGHQSPGARTAIALALIVLPALYVWLYEPRLVVETRRPRLAVERVA